MHGEALRWLDLADTALAHSGADAMTQSHGLTARALALKGLGRSAEGLVKGLGRSAEGLVAMERSLALAKATLAAEDPELAWAHMTLGAFLDGDDDARALACGDMDAGTQGGRAERKTIDEWARDHLRTPPR
jgi:hypothetical protein